MDAGSKVQSTIAYVARLASVYSQPHISLQSCTQDVDLYLNALPLKRDELSKARYDDLKSNAIKLWNLVAQRLAQDEDTSRPACHAAAKTIAYLCFESLAKRKRRSTIQTHRLFELSLSAIRDCLKASNLELAQRISEFAADHYQNLSNLHEEENDKWLIDSITEAKRKYLHLRVCQDWKRGRLDLAEHWHKQSSDLGDAAEGQELENLLDLFYEIGVDELVKGHCEVAVRWLGRSITVLDNCSEDFLYSIGHNLPSALFLTYAQALVKSGDQASRSKAQTVLDKLEAKDGRRLVLSLMRIELLSQDPNPSVHAFSTELGSIGQDLHLTPANHKTMMCYIHRLGDHSLPQALECLEWYICHRLLDHDVLEWTEAAVVTYMWFASENAIRFNRTSTDSTRHTLNRIVEARKMSLSTAASQSILMLVWKVVQEYRSEQPPMASPAWCEIALHSLFEKADDYNIGKFRRVIMVVNMARASWHDASEAFDKMSSSQKSHKLSIYLAYCIAVRSQKHEDAQTRLLALASQCGRDNKLLFACAGEATKYASPIEAARLLQRLLDKQVNTQSPEVDIGALTRLTVRLLLDGMGNAQTPSDVQKEITQRLCSVFKNTVMLSTRPRNVRDSHGPLLSLGDCRWLEQRSYHLAIEHLQDWPVATTIDLLRYSSQIRYPEQALISQPSLKDKKTELTRNAAYVQTILYAIEARKPGSLFDVDDLPRTSHSGRERPTPSEVKTTLYRNLFDRATDLGVGRLTADGYISEDTRASYETVVPLAFEALIYLNSEAFTASENMVFDESSLLDLINQASAVKATSKTFATMADLVLSAVATSKTDSIDLDENVLSDVTIPLSSAINLLSKVIQAMRSMRESDIDQAMKWLRCIVHITIEHITREIRRSSNKPSTDSGALLSNDQSLDKMLRLLASIVDQGVIIVQSDWPRTVLVSPETQSPGKPDHSIHRGNTQPNHDNDNDNDISTSDRPLPSTDQDLWCNTLARSDEAPDLFELDEPNELCDVPPPTPVGVHRPVPDPGLGSGPGTKPAVSAHPHETEEPIFPSEELEWLSTSLFNMSIDLYISGREETAKEWVRKAIDVADLLAFTAGDINEPSQSDHQSGKAQTRSSSDDNKHYRRRHHEDIDRSVDIGGGLADTLRKRVQALGWTL